MSRSYRKPVCKLDNITYFKKAFNRRLRRQQIPIGSGNNYKKHNLSYDICDFNTGILSDEYIKHIYGEKAYQVKRK